MRRQAIDGHFYMTYSSYAHNDSIMQEGTSVGDWRRRYEFECAQFNTSTSEYASYIYDSVWTYALALDKLLTGNESLAADFHTDHTTESVYYMQLSSFVLLTYLLRTLHTYSFVDTRK